MMDASTTHPGYLGSSPAASAPNYIGNTSNTAGLTVVFSSGSSAPRTIPIVSFITSCKQFTGSTVKVAKAVLKQTNTSTYAADI
jgi:hypothetical protein